MTVFDLVARARMRIARLLQVETSVRALVAVVALLLLGAVLLGGARWIALPRLTPFLIWAIAVSAAVLIARWGARRWTRIAEPSAIAHAVEREHGLRNGSVRGLVELSGDGSPFVRRAAQRMGTQLGVRGALLPALEHRLRHGIVRAAGVLLPLALIMTLSASRSADGWRVLAHPVDAWRGTLLPRIEIADAPHRTLRGTAVSLAVHAPGRSIVSLRRRTTGNAWVETPLAVVRGIAVADLGPLDADVTIVASDGRAESDTVIVRVVDRPFLGDVAVRATYPAYLHKAGEALPSDAPIRVPQGTELTLDGHASEPLAAVTLSQGRDSIRLVPAERRFRGHFTPSATASWSWSARGVTTAIADVPAPLLVEVVPDSAPSAEILAPASDSLIAATDKVELQLLAADDHGLQSVTLKLWRVGQSGSSVAPTMQKLAGGGIPDWSGIVSLDLSAFGLEAGDAVHVQLIARDESPAGQEGTSRELVLRVPATDEQRRSARDAADSAASRAVAAAKAQGQLQQRTQTAANAAARPSTDKNSRGTQPMQFDGAQQAKALASEQKAMADRVQKLQQSSKALEDRLRAAGALDTALAAQLREAQRLLREALTPEMLDALKKLDNSAQQLSGEQSKQSLAQLVEQQKKLREALEKSAEILKRAALEGAMQTLKDEAKEIAKQERAVGDSGSQQTPASAQRLGERTQQLAKDLAALKERLQQEHADPAAKKTSEALDEALKAKSALEQMQPNGPKGAQGKPQSSAGQQSGQGQQGASSAGQKGSQAGQGQSGEQGQQGARNAADAMQRASEALAEGRKAQVDEWKQELTSELDRSVQEMMQLARQQDALAEKAKQNPNDNSLRSAQSALQQGVQKAGDRLQGESRKSALVSPNSQKAVSTAEQKVAQASKDAADPRTSAQAQSSMSDAATALRQAAAALARDRERAGASQSASGLPELLAQLQQLAQAQGALNGQMQSFLQANGANKGRQLSSDAQAQARGLAKSQRDVARQLDEVGDADATGRAAELAREARQLAQSLEQGAADPTVFERQQRLFTRMLDAGRTLENDQKDESGRRESRPGDQNNPFVPPNAPVNGRSANKYRVPEWNELRGLNAEERRLVIEYFRRLNGDKP